MKMRTSDKDQLIKTDTTSKILQLWKTKTHF